MLDFSDYAGVLHHLDSSGVCQWQMYFTAFRTEPQQTTNTFYTFAHQLLVLTFDAIVLMNCRF